MSAKILTDAARDALVEGALRGVTQIQGDLADVVVDDAGNPIAKARCAIGLMSESLFGAPRYAGSVEEWGKLFMLSGSESGVCPECCRSADAQMLVVHVNDDHGWDFLTIARKLGGDA